MQMKSMKDSVCPGLPRRSSKPTKVPQAQTKGPSIPTDTGDVHDVDVGVIIDFEIEE